MSRGVQADCRSRQALLTADGAHCSRSGFISKNKFEREADTFATEFLMPWKLLQPIVGDRERGPMVIHPTSEQCESSIPASAIRYPEISRECVAAFVSHQGRIEALVDAGLILQD